MISTVIWICGLAFGIAAVCLAAALELQTGHLVATALVSFGIVAMAVNDDRGAETAGASSFARAAAASRYMGILWAWSAISAYVVYAFLLDWVFWQPAVVAMFVACGLCFFLGMILDRDGAAETPDQTSVKLADVVLKGQFGVGALLLGVLIAARLSDAGIGGPDRWVALNLMLCTAAALLTVSGYLILNRHGTARTPAAA
jgi:hypothetical protein